MGRNVALSTGSTVLAVGAAVVGLIAVATPYWATFENRIGSEDGHFGLWTLCRRNNRDFRCGTRVSRLQPSEYTTAAGVCGVVALLGSAVMCAMSPMVLAMHVTRRHVVVQFRTATIVKLAVSCTSAIAALLALVFFGIEMDAERLGENVGFHVRRSWSFALMVVFLLMLVAMAALASVEFVLARRLGGDPVKMARDPTGSLAPVIANPGAREGAQGAPPGSANGVRVIHGPQQPAVIHQRTVQSGGQRWPPRPAPQTKDIAPAPAALPLTCYNGKPIPFDPGKSPLRSSMKKKRASQQSSVESTDASVTIIQNPSAGSPTRSKKVRINTLDTAV